MDLKAASVSVANRRKWHFAIIDRNLADLSASDALQRAVVEETPEEMIERRLGEEDA